MKISKLNEEVSDCETLLYHYKRGLSQIEARLVEFKTQEIKFCEKIRGLERDVEVRNNKIKYLMNEQEQVKKEKEGLDNKLTGFENASKDLENLLGSQRLDKNKEGLGYNAVPPPSAQVYSPPKKDLIFVRVKMSRDVITVGSTMRIPLLHRGEYSQWREMFMNYLEEQTDGEAMINSIQNGDHPLPVVAQVSFAGTAQNAIPTLKDLKFWSAEEKKTRKIDRLARSLLIQGLLNDIYSLIDSNDTAKDLWDALERQMRGSEYGEQDRKATILYEYETFKATEGEHLLDTYLCYLQKQYGTLTRQTKNLMDINIDALYNILKQNQGDLNDALGYKKKAVVVTSDPLALVAEKTKVSKRKKKVKVQTESEGSDDDDITVLAKAFNRKKYYAKPTNNNLRTSLASSSAYKKPKYVKSVKKKEDKKADEKKKDTSKEINANMVFMAQIEKVLSDSDESSSYVEETIAEVAYYTSESENESEFKTSEYYDNSTNYGLFVNNDDDHEIFYDAIASASENFIENHIDFQKDCDESEVDHNDSEAKDHLIDKLIQKFNHKIAKCHKRIEKANQQSKDLENQNKDLQDKYDVLINQVNTFEEKTNAFHEQVKVLNEKNADLLAQTEVLKEQLKVKHVVIDIHTECFKNLSYFEKAKDLRPSLYDVKVIGLGYTLMFFTHSNEALEIEKFKRVRENKIEFAYDFGNLNASYVNEKINFSDDYFQKIINPDFEKIDSPFQQTSSLKPSVPADCVRSVPAVYARPVHAVCARSVPAVCARSIVQICLWIIDLGCSKHMTGNHALLTNFVEKFLGMVRFGNTDFAVIADYGDVVIGSMTIKKVYYVEGLGHNLFSVG
nr:integrase, catalytic region, zinc finger, CCHC-type, peptidase aspartic, catalytic [Tanacetum cinerariifolium]